MNKEQGRDLLIHKICFSVLRKRLTQMREYVRTLKAMPDEDLYNEWRKYK